MRIILSPKSKRDVSRRDRIRDAYLNCDFVKLPGHAGKHLLGSLVETFDGVIYALDVSIHQSRFGKGSRR